jgi:TonB family protein
MKLLSKAAVVLVLVATCAVSAQAQAHDFATSVPPLVHADVPLYPAVAVAARLSGTVRVKFRVSKGSVVSTETDSSAHAILVNAAEKNAKTWQFGPDIDGSFELTYVYQLEAVETSLPENPRIEMRLPIIKITAQPVKRTTVR